MKGFEMANIDPIQFGRLLNAVDTLEKNVQKLSGEVEELNHKLSSGKGLMVGVLITAGGLGAGATKIIEHLFK
jgi:hypothetical protein